MIQILDKTRTIILAVVDVEQLHIELDIQQYSKLLLSLHVSQQQTFAKDFANLLKLNDDFNTDLLESYLHLFMARYNLLINYGVDEIEEVPY